jgi:hypothetical protein
MNLNEVSPGGWSGTVAAMIQKHPELSKGKKKNPWALAWHMKNKGAKSHYKEQPGKESQHPKEPVKKEDKPKKRKKKVKKSKKKGCFCEWLKVNHPEFLETTESGPGGPPKKSRQMRRLPLQTGETQRPKGIGFVTGKNQFWGPSKPKDEKK